MLEKIKALGEIRLKANHAPEAKKRLEALICHMRKRVGEENERIRKERIAAEIFFRNRRLRMST